MGCDVDDMRNEILIDMREGLIPRLLHDRIELLFPQLIMKVINLKSDLIHLLLFWRDIIKIL